MLVCSSAVCAHTTVVELASAPRANLVTIREAERTTLLVAFCRLCNINQTSGPPSGITCRVLALAWTGRRVRPLYRSEGCREFFSSRIGPW